MISMQYSFTLPADYDMEIIDRRIRDKGPALDGFPHLRFKSYLTIRKGELGSEENLYAPFYLWQQPEGASNFLTGPGFAAVADAFGRPSVKTWIVWHAEISPEIAKARFATRRILPIEPTESLGELRAIESDVVQADIAAGGALASVSGFEPTSWTRVNFQLWAGEPPLNKSVQAYRVGHISLP